MPQGAHPHRAKQTTMIKVFSRIPVRANSVRIPLLRLFKCVPLIQATLSLDGNGHSTLSGPYTR